MSSPGDLTGIPMSSIGLRRSTRIQNRLQGFRKDCGSRQCMHVDHDARSKGKEVALPELPSLEDFSNCSNSHMVPAPLSIGQIQHAATHLCGVDPTLVSEGELSLSPGRLNPQCNVPKDDNVGDV
ncbi:hypothetical protein GUJ93_ZPchr0009g2230 [Zizania palustris]|uniref:Uncharacterized protein n=1 Tax=Zizania palustris TaxID=103762 RepID=A0A8J5V2Q4_ZIZPA|nr:hypothetical protein GUJ93_ZPchr0009g2230 [Zizania palustris]